ncbi:MAG: addiction module protein [Deltaproteobacteria bacterium]|nr:addiction module protein [Deltaproteobacteria bacterium]MBW2651131.1 addiction module protein [Deltaproteobacteria bacterium]
MAISVDDLATKAMTLSGEARALLAERLVESLDQESVREIWLTEAKKRRDEVRSGLVRPIPGVEVMEDVRKLIDEK